MLAKVKAIWIDGLLEQSLSKELRIALNLTDYSHAVELPLNTLVQELNQPARELPANTPIIALSSMTGPEAIAKARKAGFHDFVAKFDRQGLVAALKEHSQDAHQAA